MTLILNTFYAMGCQVTVQLDCPSEAVGWALLESLPSQFEALEAQLSRFRPTSDLNALNRQAGQWTTVSDVLFENVALAKHGARLTDGLFNPLILPALVANGYDRDFQQIGYHGTENHGITVADWHDILLNIAEKRVQLPQNSAIDLGGIAKGWVATVIANHLSQDGPCLVNVGGDMVARGTPTGSHGWEIYLEDPYTRQAFLAISLLNESIVTSGQDYRTWHTDDGIRQHHLIDPRTGKPAKTDVFTVTILHPHAPTAEAFAKSVLIQGAEAGLKWLNQQWDARGLVVTTSGAILATDSLLTRGRLLTEINT